MGTLLESVNEHLHWIRVKIGIDLQRNSLERHAYPCKKEIWWVSLGKNVGVEANGKNYSFERPVVVLHVFKNASMLVVPLTTTISENEHIFSFTSSKGTSSLANISQIRTLSTKRFIRNIGYIQDEDFIRLVDLIKLLILKSETPLSGVSSEPSK